MLFFTALEVQRDKRRLRREALQAPVGITHHGQPDLVVMSAEAYEQLRATRRRVWTRAEMPLEKIQRIANNEAGPEFDHLDHLVDD